MIRRYKRSIYYYYKWSSSCMLFYPFFCVSLSKPFSFKVCPTKMVFGAKRFSIFVVIIFMVVLIPFVHSSRTRLQGGTRVEEDAARVAEDVENNLVKRLERGASALAVEDSARKVPTGPDPLHHNNQPTSP